MCPQNILCRDALGFEKILWFKSTFIEKLFWQQLILQHRKSMSFWQRMRINGIKRYFYQSSFDFTSPTFYAVRSVSTRPQSATWCPHPVRSTWFLTPHLLDQPGQKSSTGNYSLGLLLSFLCSFL